MLNLFRIILIVIDFFLNRKSSIIMNLKWENELYEE
jgi:hypothetical protein